MKLVPGDFVQFCQFNEKNCIYLLGTILLWSQPPNSYVRSSAICDLNEQQLLLIVSSMIYGRFNELWLCVFVDGKIGWFVPDHRFKVVN